MCQYNAKNRRFINTVAVCLSGADAVCMAVLAVAALKWEGTDKAKRADNAVIIIQLMVLVGESCFCVLGNSLSSSGPQIR